MLLGDTRDPDRCLRATWHPDAATVVFSHWNGSVCVASTPVDVADLSDLVGLLMVALRQSAPPVGALGAHQGGE